MEKKIDIHWGDSTITCLVCGEYLTLRPDTLQNHYVTIYGFKVYHRKHCWPKNYFNSVFAPPSTYTDIVIKLKNGEIREGGYYVETGKVVCENKDGTYDFIELDEQCIGWRNK